MQEFRVYHPHISSMEDTQGNKQQMLPNRDLSPGDSAPVRRLKDGGLLAHLSPPLSPKPKGRKVDSLGMELLSKDSESRRDILQEKFQPHPKARNTKSS